MQLFQRSLRVRLFQRRFEGAAFSAEFEAAFTAHGDLLAAFSAEFPRLLFKITLNSRSLWELYFDPCCKRDL